MKAIKVQLKFYRKDKDVDFADAAELIDKFSLLARGKGMHIQVAMQPEQVEEVGESESEHDWNFENDGQDQGKKRDG